MHVTTSTWEETVLDYWDNKRDDTINLLPGTDDFVHSHFSVIDFDRSVLDAPPETREQAILDELHRLENRQVEIFLGTLGPVGPDDLVLDNGCGRGGTAFTLYDMFGCSVHGVDLSPYRLGCARTIADRRGCGDRVTFHLGNMTATGFPTDHFQYAVTNEAAEHLESMDELCREMARVLRPGGRYATATWVANDRAGQASDEVAKINANYRTKVHTRASYLKAMVTNDLIPCRVEELTAEAIPYWELRSESAHRTGVEPAFLSAFGNRLMNYLFIVAEYQPDQC